MNIGDRFFERSTGVIGKAIRWFGREPGEPRTLASHCGVFVGDNLICHATWPRVTVDSWAEYVKEVEKDGGSWAIVRRTPPLINDDAQKVRDVCWRRMGKRYSAGEIALQAMDRALGKLRPSGRPLVAFRRLGDVLPGLVCSHLLAEVDIALGDLPDTAKCEYADPDDLWDFEMRHPERYFVEDCTTGWWTRGALRRMPAGVRKLMTEPQADK